MSRGDKPKPVPLGPSGLPSFVNFDYEQTSSNATETNITAPLSTQTNNRPTLTVVVGMDAGRVLRITEPETTIGRATTCDLVLPDQGVSRLHARLIRAPDGFILEDVGSKNGTFVNDELVTQRRVGYGVPIQVGPHVLIRLGLMTSAE